MQYQVCYFQLLLHRIFNPIRWTKAMKSQLHLSPPGSELQVRLDSHRSRRQMSREANRIVNDLMAKDAEHRTRDVGVQTDHSCFVENIDDLKLKFKKAKSDLCIQKKKSKSSHKEAHTTRNQCKKAFKIRKTLIQKCTPAQAKRVLTPDKKWFHYSKKDIVTALIVRSMSKRVFEYLRQT
ncbi:Uncharacterized protein FKW44_023233, partial [Caligus rogercresseyi]